MHFGLLSAEKATKEYFDPRDIIDIDSDEDKHKTVKTEPVQTVKAILPL